MTIHLTTFYRNPWNQKATPVHTALNEDSVLSELQRQSYKLIILDLKLWPDGWIEALEKLRADGLETPVMVLSARNRVSDVFNR